MTYTTRTEEFGKATFTAPAADEDNLGYVWIETERGYASKERRQVCHGGDFKGSTIMATADGVQAVAQQWLRQRRDWQRKEGIV
ncbi:hypothetical protein DDZ14_08625 [Maritimibacter sp. 55A14]|uniref:hypothetical protein n=1 Tax=Maritimibacter sp. 55A14 TaxID=2174844 RepID=UPI000D6053B1|nr:hypothetical protein [Maritimibacter sp. 55A14]PWE32799.1 hypothetical protein DDZ14_08625 [Maritimibacter sp. 55A14]